MKKLYSDYTDLDTSDKNFDKLKIQIEEHINKIENKVDQLEQQINKIETVKQQPFYKSTGIAVTFTISIGLLGAGIASILGASLFYYLCNSFNI